MSECWLNCEDDAMCRYECFVKDDQCVQSCPCFSVCPDGCKDCSNSICPCAIPDEDPDYLICSGQVELVYLSCVVGCTPGDAVCLSNCARDYNNTLDQCPCQVTCEITKIKIHSKQGRLS